jgi:hypothetical protein
VRGGRRKDEVLMGGGMDDGRSVRVEGKPRAGAELEMFGQNGRSAPRSSSIAILRLACDWRILGLGMYVVDNNLLHFRGKNSLSKLSTCLNIFREIVILILFTCS